MENIMQSHEIWRAQKSMNPLVAYASTGIALLGVLLLLRS